MGDLEGKEIEIAGNRYTLQKAGQTDFLGGCLLIFLILVAGIMNKCDNKKKLKVASQQSAADFSPNVIAKTGSNIRSLPETNSDVITTIQEGTKLQALKISKNKKWMLIMLPNRTKGWIHIKLLGRL